MLFSMNTLAARWCWIGGHFSPVGCIPYNDIYLVRFNIKTIVSLTLGTWFSTNGVATTFLKKYKLGAREEEIERRFPKIEKTRPNRNPKICEDYNL